MRSAGFMVLKAADVPSVLIELGFLSSKEDERQLTSPAWQEKVAAALAWMLTTHGNGQLRPEADALCRTWAADSSEVKRLEEAYFPERSAARQVEDRQASEERQRALEGQMSSMANLLANLAALVKEPIER